MCALLGVIWLEWYEAKKQTDKTIRNKLFFKYLFRTFLVCCLLTFLVCHPLITWDEELDLYVTPEMVQSVSLMTQTGGFQMPISILIPVFALKLHITDINYTTDFENLGTWVGYDQYTFVGPFYVGVLSHECPSGLPAIPLPYGGVHS